MRVVLASSSPYRRELLGRLRLDFEVDVPAVDETRLADETPAALVQRLARDKAAVVASRQPDALVIGCDQVATMGDEALGKPGSFERNVEQLLQLSGQTVQFLVGLCVINTCNGSEQLEVVPFDIGFRSLSRAQIEAYVRREQPLDCAAGVRSEGLGIALFEHMSGDPSALIGLPLVRLVTMLANEGLDVLLHEQG